MATVEERLSGLEARVDAHATGLNDLRQAVVSLEVRMDGRFDAVDRRFGILESQIARLTTIVVVALTAMLAIAAGALFR